MKLSIAKIPVFLFVLMLCSFFSCKRDNNLVPDVLVDIQVNINNPGYYQLQAIGGWMYFDGGSRGIIVYRKSLDEFLAFDRHCTYNVNDACGKVVVDGSNIIAEDACCGSKFILTDGSVQQGPATFALKAYQTYYDGQGILRVYN